MHYQLLFLVIVIIVCAVFIDRYVLSPLAKYPGPFLASVSRLWYTYINWRGIQHEVLETLHIKYGDIIRIAPNEVYVHIKPPYAPTKVFKVIYVLWKLFIQFTALGQLVRNQTGSKFFKAVATSTLYLSAIDRSTQRIDG